MRGGRRLAGKAVVLLLQLLLAVVVLLPFFWMLSVSLKPATEPFAIPARLWPDHPTVDNYVTAFRPEFRQYFLNSVIVSAATLAITIPLARFTDSLIRARELRERAAG